MPLFFIQGILNVFIEWSLDSPKTKQAKTLHQVQNIAPLKL